MAKSTAPSDADPASAVTLRLRKSSVDAILLAAKERGLTMKQLVCKALTNEGIAITDVDLQDRTPRRHP